jgi:hypothetical protein
LQVAEAFTHLGFPDYFRVELSWAKLLGVVLLLAPVPARLEEWAYAGFAITLGSALIAHLSVGDGPEPWGWAAGTGVLWGSRTSSGAACRPRRRAPDRAVSGVSSMAGKTMKKTAAKKKTATKSAKGAKKVAARRVAPKPTLLSGGNPQIAKADGDAPVQAYIAAMPGWKRDVGRRLDALIVRTVPGVRKAVKWNSPFYGVEGQGWFLNFHTFTNYVKVAFFRGTSLRPVPPGESRHNEVRYLDIRENDPHDEAQMATWIRQAATLPGWVP